MIIYALKDPFTYEVIYIGKTNGSAETRLGQHIYQAMTLKSKTALAKWLRGMIRKGRLPLVEVVETVTGDWEARERYWIKYYRLRGDGLKNATIGGAGVRKF